MEGFSALPVALLPSAEGLPDELSGLVASIQATNMQMRTLEESYTAIDSSLLVLQEGAELRDQQTAAYRWGEWPCALALQPTELAYCLQCYAALGALNS